MNRPLSIAAAAALSLGSVVLAGCSQIDSLAQVSGVPVNTLQIAADELLVDNKIPVLVAPSCVQNSAGTQVDCEGSTTNGQKISVTANNLTAATFTLAPGGTPTPAPNGALNMTMVLKVGDRVLYRGSVQDVIEENAVRNP